MKRIKMKDNDFMIRKCKSIVGSFYNESVANPLDYELTCIDLEEIYIVWFCKTLQNFKALLSTDKADTRYYEVTYNGDKDEYYLDCYIKERNKLIKR